MASKSLREIFLVVEDLHIKDGERICNHKFSKVNSLKKKFGPEPIVRMITPLKLNEARNVKAVSVIGRTV